MKLNTSRIRAASLRQGFTIIELLVAVAVTALLVSLMLGIVVNITGGWNRSSGSLESGNQARVVLDQLTSDLQAAIIRNDSNVWMAAKMASPSTAWVTGGAGQNTAVIPAGTTPPLPALENYRFGPSGVWFRFFSTVPGTNTTGDLTTLSAPRAVAYQIIRRPVVDGSNEHRYQLYRSEVLPNLTFTAGYNLMDAAYTGGSAANNAPGSIRTPTTDSVIANNVVDFGVRILDASGNILFPLDATDEHLVTAGTVAPDSIEIFVRILSGEGAQQLFLLENPPAGYTPSGTWWDIVEANSRVYTRRVDLKAEAL
jgi:prepilin-type N-terminal cleavage/methylation domain-containing protein